MTASSPILLPLSENTTTFTLSLAPLTHYRPMDQESFDRLLRWLHSDRDEAGKIYVQIQAELTKTFRSHGCSSPDKLADDTIERVDKKLPEILDKYVGERIRYFRRVGYYILLEYFAKKTEEVELVEGLPSPPPPDEIEAEYECLEQCLKQLPHHKRALIEKYYQGDKATKKRLRKELAGRLKIELPALRLQAQRIRAVLKICIVECLKV